MKRIIKKAAVLGSGIMGSRIACHFANIGLQVVLLDIVPKELNEDEKNNGLTLSDKAVRNRIVKNSLDTAVKSNPSPIYKKAFVDRIRIGNFDDDMPWIADADWVIEVVVENLEIKKKVFESVEKFRKPGTLITSNTSGIPIHLMTEGRSDDFRKHFCGTHFFNPPRYLKLLEIIPTDYTGPEIVDFLMNYGKVYLGKTTVLCKDTPAFISNRVGIYGLLKVFQVMQKLDLSIDEVDKLTGPVIGRPKSATFRTSDLVGLDTLIKVANNLHDALKEDEERDIFSVPEFILDMEKNNWLGDKTRQGFYKKTKDKSGKTEILTLDLKDLTYKPKKKAQFQTLELTKSIDKVNDRFKILLGGKDKAAAFYRESFSGVFQYISNRIPEITDDLYKIDDALCAGFGWESGPFETWDAIGVESSIKMMKDLGYEPNEWVLEMVKNGNDSFYKVDEGKRFYYDISSKGYKQVPGLDEFIILEHLRKSRTVWENSGASIFDLGDGILNIEFHSKMNTMGGEVIEGINHGIDLAERDFQGVVIGNQGANFSAGANLGILFMNAIEQEYDEIDLMIRHFQKTMMRARYSSVPVVVAPHGLTLGGGCELTLHADLVQAAAETYIGLVEVGVGLIPAGGGTKELTKRISDSMEEGDVELNALQNTFMNIATAKVATSAHEAYDLHIMRAQDRISVNREKQIRDAKAAALQLAENGYTMPNPVQKIKVLGKSGIALFLAGIQGMKTGKYISEHDAKIGTKIAHVMCGGELSYPTFVPEQYLLDLEREAFLSLLGERKTLERIQAILQGQKPLRN